MNDRPYRFDFFRYRLLWLLISASIIAAGVFAIQRNGLRYSVDFTGGILVNMHFAQPVRVIDIRHSLDSINLGDSLIQEFGSKQDIIVRVAQNKAEKLVQTNASGEMSVEAMLEQLSNRIQEAVRAKLLTQNPPENQKDLNNTGLVLLSHFLIQNDPAGLIKELGPKRSEEQYKEIAKKIYDRRMDVGGLIQNWKDLFSQVIVPEKIQDFLQSQFYLGPFTVMQTEFVGPQVGKELKEKTRLAVIFSLIGMLLYIWIRFDLLFGVAAVICLIHDFFVTLSIFALTHREISLTVVAAFLTIIGYSLNDTIVVYDRIRENKGKRQYSTLYDLYNASINQTLSRTLLTGLTTLFVVIVLYSFGGEVINDFAFALLIGIVVGTYSSIYVASSLASYWQEYRSRRARQVAPSVKSLSKKGKI